MLFFSSVASVRRATTATMTVATVLLYATNAFADLKLITTTTTTGRAATAKPQERPVQVVGTNYYQGKKMRSESAQGTILFDGEKKVMYSINDANKTYSIVPLDQMMKSPLMQMFEIKTAVTMKPGGKTRKLLGKTVKNYVYTATVKMSPGQKFLEQRKAQGNTSPLPELPTIVMEGENWVTENVNLPPGAVMASLSSLSSVPGMKPLLDKLGSIKGIPLETKLVVRQQDATQSTPMQTMTTVATAIEEKTLPASLFVIPKGYTLTQPPRALSRPGA